VAAQTQFVGGYTGYPLLPAATTVQWLPQGQPVPSIFSPVYPHHGVNYRGIVGSVGAPWFFYNPYRKQVQVSEAGATQAAGSSRTRRQIQLRYRGGGRNGRSLNEITTSETAPATGWKSVDAAPSRTKRQIVLPNRGNIRRGRSLNEPARPVSSAYPFPTDAAPSRKPRQIQLRYRNAAGRRRIGRSLDGLLTTA